MGRAVANELTSSLRRGTNLPRLADFNESVVLDSIRRSSEGLSRVELTETTGLSAQTVSNICRRLLEQGFIAEAGKSSSGLGKPRTMLKLNPAGCYAVGVHLDPAVVTLALLDFQGHVVAHDRQVVAAAGAPDQLLLQISNSVNELVASAGVDRQRVLGVGIASPGPLDLDKGLVLDPPHLLQWHRVPLRDHLRDATGLPVLLDKDVIAAAVAERWAGQAAGSKNFVFIYLGTGIGAGFVVDDVVVRGTSGNAGDIGGFRVASRDGSVTGSLGETTTPEALVREALATGILGPTPGADDPHAVDESFGMLCRLATQGHEDAGAILDRAAVRIGGAVSNLTNLLDVDTVVFGGTMWSRVAERYLTTISDIVKRSSITQKVHPTRIVGTALGEEVGAIGAACLVFDDKFSARPSSLLLAG